MDEKTYRARTMKEALARVRRDLGGDAVILASREVRRRRLFGLGPRELIEVTASATMPSGHATLVAEAAARNASWDAAGSSLSPASQAQFGEQLSRLHAMVETLSRQGRIDHLLPDLPGELIPTYARLVEAEIPEVLARRLVRYIADNLEPNLVGNAASLQAAACARPSSGAFRSRRRSGLLWEPAGWWHWSGQPGSARQPLWPSSRPT